MTLQRTGKPWSPHDIWLLLRQNDRAVEKALVAIFNRQTQDEQSSEDTRHLNRVGFTAADAKRGSYYAKWIISGKSLTGDHLNKGREIACRYLRQLAEIANNR